MKNTFRKYVFLMLLFNFFGSLAFGQPPSGDPCPWQTVTKVPQLIYNGGGGGGGDEGFEYDDYGDQDYGDGGDDIFYNDVHGGGTNGSSLCSIAKALNVVNTAGTWEKYAQIMGWSNFTYTGPITDPQKYFLSNKIYPDSLATLNKSFYGFLCNPSLLGPFLKSVDIVMACGTLTTNGSYIDKLLDFFVMPNQVSAASAKQSTKLLNCYYGSTIGTNFADCVFPVGTIADAVTVSNVLALEEYLKTNPKDKDWVNKNGCEILSILEKKEYLFR